MSRSSPHNAKQETASPDSYRLAPAQQRRGLLVAVFLGVGLLAAACGGSTSPGVANLGSSSSTTVAGTAAGNSGSSTLTPQQLQTITAFAVCVREHGLPGFPDPAYSDGELNRLGYRKLSPRMVAATNKCPAQALAAGVVQTPAEIQQHLEQRLQITKCMRAHGIMNFPDPNANGSLTAPVGTPSSSINVSSPQYAAAAKTCGGPPG